MVKQWVQPPINKNRLPPGGFSLGSHLTSFTCFLLLRLSLEFRGKLRNPVFGNSLYICLMVLIRDSVKFEINLLFLFRCSLEY